MIGIVCLEKQGLAMRLGKGGETAAALFGVIVVPIEVIIVHFHLKESTPVKILVCLTSGSYK